MTVDMSPEAIDARLQRVSELSDLDRDRRLEGKIDYSPEAIAARLQEVEQLRRLCLSLNASRPLIDG